MNKLISYRYNRSNLLREISIQFTGGVGAKTYINSTIVYLYSLWAEIWFKSEHYNIQNWGDLSRLIGMQIKIMPHYKITAKLHNTTIPNFPTRLLNHLPTHKYTNTNLLNSRH
jgi:hypothetical protein